MVPGSDAPAPAVDADVDTAAASAEAASDNTAAPAADGADAAAATENAEADLIATTQTLEAPAVGFSVEDVTEEPTDTSRSPTPEATSGEIEPVRYVVLATCTPPYKRPHTYMHSSLPSK